MFSLPLPPTPLIGYCHVHRSLFFEKLENIEDIRSSDEIYNFILEGKFEKVLNFLGLMGNRKKKGKPFVLQL